MRAGPYAVRLVDAGWMLLDGGGMFGAVPRTTWSRDHVPDAANRVRVALRLLHLAGEGRSILVDAGYGAPPAEPEAGHQGLSAVRDLTRSLRAAGIEPEGITDVILTHLHVDHAGGITGPGPDTTPRLTLPHAMHHVQRRNLETARSPDVRERRSYLRRTWEPLLAGRLRLVDGAEEILPGIHAEPGDGHTRGLQALRIGEGRETLLYPSDAIPLASHVALPWTMAYDQCPRTLVEEKRRLLDSAADGGWRLILEHDPGHPVVRVERNENRFRARPVEESGA